MKALSLLLLIVLPGVFRIDAESVTVDTSRKGAMTAVTDPNTGNNQLLYFTSPSLTADDRHLVFISDRTGNPNLFTRDLVTGVERQLTTNNEGVLKSYVYFNGTPYRGFGKGSVSLDPKNGVVYFIQGREIRSVTLAGRQRILAVLPTNQMTAFTHVSADGTRLCVPTTDARALDDDKILPLKPGYDIDKRVVDENLSSYLRVYDTTTGKEILCERVPGKWITHVQFSPVDANLILYNSEYCADSGIRRMWLWNGKTHLRLRTEGDGRSRFDWTCHEMWERDGKAIIYHGTYTNGVSYIGRVLPDGTGRVEIPLPAKWKRYGHFTVGQPGELVTDGYYEEVGDNHLWGGAWISLLQVDWKRGQINWFPILRHGSSWTSQDSHPHPVFNHAADEIWFTAELGGQRAVCCTKLTTASGLGVGALPGVSRLRAEPASVDSQGTGLATTVSATNSGDNQLHQAGNSEPSATGHSVEMSYRDHNPLRDALLPVPKSAIFKMDGFYLWDPSIIKVGDTFNLFVSRWPASNGMGGWMKSDVVRAVSKSLFGPYVFAGVVLDPAHHPWAGQGIANPKVMRVGNRFLLHYLGIPKWQTGFAFADKIEGPWTVVDKPVIPTMNASLLIKPDGKVYAVGKFKINSPTPNQWNAFMRAYEADDILGPYRVVADNGNRLPNGFELEDPALWWANNQYNLLCTDWQGKMTGINKPLVYYTSKDGIHYKLFSNMPVWSWTDPVPVVGGDELKIIKVERPEVYLDTDGKVEAILASVHPVDGATYIVIRPVDHFLPANQ